MDTTVTYIDRHDSLRPVGPQATQSLLDEKKIPTLQEHEYQQWAEYLFSAPLPLQLQVAETLVRHDRQHSYALFLFLACTEPSAAKFSRRLAYKIFLHPPDLTLELMYDGAMTALMTLLKRDFVLADTSFPVFLFTVIKNGATLGKHANPHLGKKTGPPTTAQTRRTAHRQTDARNNRRSRTFPGNPPFPQVPPLRHPSTGTRDCA